MLTAHLRAMTDALATATTLSLAACLEVVSAIRQATQSELDEYFLRMSTRPMQDHPGFRLQGVQIWYQLAHWLGGATAKKLLQALHYLLTGFRNSKIAAAMASLWSTLT